MHFVARRARSSLGIVVAAFAAACACAESPPRAADGGRGAEDGGPIDSGPRQIRKESGAADAHQANAGDATVDAQYHCGAIEVLPPLVRVVDVETGAPICDVTFSLAATGDAGSAPTTGDASIGVACSTEDIACVVSSVSVAAAPCEYGLRLEDFSVSTIWVRAPGYMSNRVAGVSNGRGGGCFPYQAPSIITVALQPLSGDSGGGGP